MTSLSKVNNLANLALEKILVFLIVVFFFRPPIIERFSEANLLFNLGLLGSMLLYVLIRFIKKDVKISSFTLVVTLFFLLLLWSTYEYSGSISRAIMYVGIGILTLFVFESFFRNDLDFFLDSMNVLAWLFVPLNLLIMIAIPHGFANNGVHPVYLLGQATRFVFFLIPAFTCLIIRDYRRAGKISSRTLCLYTLSLLSLIIGQTVAGILLFGVMIPFVYALNKPLVKRLATPLVFFVVQLLAFYLITFVGIQDQFANIIQEYLQKDATLSSRTYIWSTAIMMINSSPSIQLFGVGILQNDEMIAIFNFVHCHNHMLQLMLNAGYIGFLLFEVAIAISYRKLSKWINNPTAKVIAFSIFIFSLVLLFDTVDGVRNYYLVLLILGVCIGDICYKPSTGHTDKNKEVWNLR